MAQATPEMDTQWVPARDGRVRRSERSREAIVTALFELVGRGVLQPTAQQVADRAGVGMRSVFRHFSEMESLHRAMDARLEAEAAKILVAGERGGPLEQRVRALLAQRLALFERVAPYKRSANLLRWRSKFLQERHLRMQRLLRADLARWLPELSRAAPDVREAIDLALSFEAWDRLRVDQRLSAQQAATVVERIATALLRDVTPRRARRR